MSDKPVWSSARPEAVKTTQPASAGASGWRQMFRGALDDDDSPKADVQLRPGRLPTGRNNALDKWPCPTCRVAPCTCGQPNEPS